MAAWPSTLPAPLLSGFGLERAPGALRTDFEQGPARSRKRYTSTVTKMSASWIIPTAADMTTFDTFYRVTIAEGSAWFDLPLTLWDGLATRVVRFTDSPKLSPLGGGRWRVDAQLEIRAS